MTSLTHTVVVPTLRPPKDLRVTPVQVKSHEPTPASTRQPIYPMQIMRITFFTALAFFAIFRRSSDANYTMWGSVGFLAALSAIVESERWKRKYEANVRERRDLCS
jgi:hypothetical protein